MSALAQGLTLINTPNTLIPLNGKVTVTWKENIEATLHYGRKPGDYSSSLSIKGKKSLQFQPNQVGFSPGVYYCIVSNGLLSSVAFTLIVESQTAPSMISPVNHSTITGSTVDLRWDQVPGVPYYHIIVSDKEAQITQESDGDLRLVGANIVWQAITSSTSIRYGSPDPSGHFSDVNQFSPPLMDQKEYNWVVLNNYGNHPGASSIVQAGLSAFKIQFSQSLNAPSLISPANGSTHQSKEMTFRWQSVTGAHHYELYLFEFIENEESESSYPVYKGVTDQVSFSVPVRSILKSEKYLWSVLALDQGGRAFPSEYREFNYDVTSSEVTITSKTSQGATLPRVTLDIHPLDGSQEVTSLLTPEGGALAVRLQPGYYTVIAKKEGFADTTKALLLESGKQVTLNLALRRLHCLLNGQIKSDKDVSIDGADVFGVSPDENTHYSTTSVAGYFSLSLPAGTWWIWSQKSGYLASDTVEIQVQSADKKLNQTLILKTMNAKISGKVNTSQGQQVVNAKVIAEFGEKRVYSYTDHSGSFNLDVSTGQWMIQALKEGYSASSVRSISIAEGEQLQVQPSLVLGADAVNINGLALSGDTGIPGVSVMANPPSGPPIMTYTDARGQFILALEKKAYTIRLSKSGFVPSQPLLLDLTSGILFETVPIYLQRAESVIRGTVVNQAGQAVAGARVFSGNFADTSAFDGNFQLYVPEGQYRVRAQKSGYAPSSVQTIPIGSQREKSGIQLKLSNQAGMITGTVRSQGTAIAYAEIIAFVQNDTITTFSSQTGQYILSVPPGIWKLRAMSQGYAAAERTNIAINHKQTLSGVDFSLEQNNGLITGVVRDNQGQDLAGAVIELQNGTGFTYSDIQGRYRLRLSQGSHQLKSHKQGYANQEHSVSLAINQTINRNFTLPSFGMITGFVQQSGGLSIWNAEVTAVSGQETVQTNTDHAGEYSLSLKQGQWQVTYDYLGYRAKSVSIQVNAGPNVQGNVVLASDPSEISTIRGSIKTSLANAISGVALTLEGHEIRTLHSEMNGSYLVERLESGHDFTVTPKKKTMFFVPAKRAYKPLQGNAENQNYKAGYYGDVSGNDKVSSYDGSLVLRISAEQDVSPDYQDQPRDSIAADVSGNGDISAYDGSLIFRYSVGLLDRFPVDEASNPEKSISRLSYRAKSQLADTGNLQTLKIDIDGDAPYYSMDALISYPHYAMTVERVEIAESDSTLHMVYHDHAGRLTIGLASLYPLPPNKTIVEVTFKSKKERYPQPVLYHIEVDENDTEIENINAVPDQFQFLGASPNPFNSNIGFYYYLPPVAETMKRQITCIIFNILGQEIHRFQIDHASPGYQMFRWDSRDRFGKSIPSGMYIVQIQAGQTFLRHKIICVR